MSAGAQAIGIDVGGTKTAPRRATDVLPETAEPADDEATSTMVELGARADADESSRSVSPPPGWSSRRAA